MTDEDAFKWCVDCIKACLPDAEAAGVVLALENHWGLSTKVENLLRIHKDVGSPWLGINLDTLRVDSRPIDGRRSPGGFFRLDFGPVDLPRKPQEA